MLKLSQGQADGSNALATRISLYSDNQTQRQRPCFSGAWGTGFSVITSFYPSNEGLIVGLIETAYGAGQMLGPIVGNVLFSWRGFSTPFNVAGCFEAFLAIICILAIPGRIVSSSRKRVDPTGSFRNYVVSKLSSNCETMIEFNKNVF